MGQGNSSKAKAGCGSKLGSRASNSAPNSTWASTAKKVGVASTSATASSAPAAKRTKARARSKPEPKPKGEARSGSGSGSKPKPKPKPQPESRSSSSSPVLSGRIAKRQTGRVEDIRQRKREESMPSISSLRHISGALFPNLGLTYYDVALTPEDIKSLRNDWLTDNVIAFWEEYLERETLQRYPQARVLLLRPSMGFLLYWSRDCDLQSTRTNLPEFEEYTHVFIPINNSDEPTEPGSGSHWSLLLVSFKDGYAFHYDSWGASNHDRARGIMMKLNKMLGLERLQGGEENKNGMKKLRFIDLEDCPQQNNGNDCGVFVCLLMRHLLVKRLLNASSEEKVSMSLGGKMVDSYGGRKEIMKIIDGLRKEAERRRSRDPSPYARKSPLRIE